MTIYIVDDEPQTTLVEQLNMLGYSASSELSYDTAFKHIKKECWNIDLIIIDEVIANTVEGNIYKRGLDLGDDVNKAFPHIPLVLFTGNKFDRDTSIDALAEKGFSHFWYKRDFETNLYFFLDKIKSSRFFQQKWDFRASITKNILNEYFWSLPDFERLKLENLYADNSYEWENYLLNTDNNAIGVRNLFSPFMEALEVRTHIRDIFRKYLDRSYVKYNMKGDWESDKPLTRLFFEYVKNPKYDELKSDIDFHSLSILFELKKIIETTRNPDDAKLTLSSRKPNVASQKPSSNEIDLSSDGILKIFKDKMICRRVIIGYNEYIRKFVKEAYNFEEICKLLVFGVTDLKNIRGKQIEYTKIVSTYLRSRLGFSVLNDTIIIEPSLIFKEEEKWLDSYAKNLDAIYKFLSNYSGQSFQNLVEWRKFVEDRKEIELYTAFVDELGDLSDRTKNILLNMS